MSLPQILYKITACFAFADAYLFFLHMFQLNSYKPKEQKQWMIKNFRKSVLPRTFFTLLSVPFLFFHSDLLFFAIFGNLIYFLINLPQKAKKPLVFTPRVKRMIGSSVVIIGILFSLITFFSKRAPAVLLFVPLLLLFPYFFVMLSNYLNQPIEKAIRNRYINDAKQILASMPNLIVIGITGSYGKTSTKFFLNKLLSAKYNVLMTPESYNTPMGVVKTIRENLRATHEIFLCEMGAKNKGDIKEICDIVHPNHGVITSIGPQHLESFRTIETILNTKFELCDSLLQDGIIFLNADNEWIAKRQIEKHAVYYGIENKEKAVFFGDHISVSEKGTDFSISINGKDSFALSTKLIGKHNVINLVGCVAVASTLGVSSQDIMLSVKRLEAVPHRLQVIDGGGMIIIDDAYNSNPSGSKAALEVLREFDGIKIMITPGMIELGTKQEQCNFDFGVNAADVCDFVLLVGTTITKSIADGLLSQNYDKNKLFVFDKLEQALAKARTIEAIGKKKIVLLENDLPDNY